MKDQIGGVARNEPESKQTSWLWLITITVEFQTETYPAKQIEKFILIFIVVDSTIAHLYSLFML